MAKQMTSKTISDKELSIIIVDDLQFSRIVVKTALKKAGYAGVRLADSAHEALRMLEEEPADVILADWMMPEMDGLQLTDHIRQKDEERGIYTAIILFTANDGIEYLVQAFEHGVDDYLRKPPNPQELAARVSSAARIAIMQNDMLETSRQLQGTIQRLQQACLIDPLTGAGNEHMLMSELKAHLQEASTRNGGVCLAMIEMTDLHKIKKEKGKIAEEEILIGIYRRIRRTVRPTDVVTRLNNNVYAILMHQTNFGSFRMSSLDRIMSAVRQRPYVTPDGDCDIATSMGVYFYKGNQTLIAAEEMLKQATLKLHEAIKQKGDDIVV